VISDQEREEIRAEAKKAVAKLPTPSPEVLGRVARIMSATINEMVRED
jgi:hypothetical protein